MFSSAWGELLEQLRQLAEDTETYIDKFLGDTGGRVLTPCVSGGFSCSPHLLRD